MSGDAGAGGALEGWGRPNGGRCSICGGETVDRCLVCGAPQCCPACCADAASEGTRGESEQATRSGMAFTHGRGGEP